MTYASADKLFLGIDGGGTHCRARIADQSGTILGEASAGAANTRLGIEHVFGEIIRAAVLALDNAGLSQSRLGDLHAGLGLAGLPLARERQRVRDYPHPFASICFATDAYAACLGAHDGGDGAILIVGTGTCGQAIVDGQELSVAGWGFEVSDMGSGARIGRRAIEMALLTHDDLAPKTGLTREIMARFDNSPDEIVAFAETARAAAYGAFCPMVFDADARGDDIAHAIIADAVSANAAILERLQSFGARQICLMGGLATPMAARMPETLRPLLVPARFDALHGAILMARRHEGTAS